MGIKRKIIKIDEGLCNGCKLCVPNCPEGALQIIDGKARLISDLFCDGLGACIGHCPQGAITIEEREAEPYSEDKVMENIVRQGENTTRAHLEHLRSHGEDALYQQAVAFLKKKGLSNPCETGPAVHAHHGGCPGSRIRELKPTAKASESTPSEAGALSRESNLQTWPIQLHLINPSAPYFKNADVLIAADCVAFSLPSFNTDFLKGKVLAIGCPKLDDGEAYADKLTAIFKNNDVKSVTVLHMEVPCCFGLVEMVKDAIQNSKKKIPLERVEISLQGEVKSR